MQLIPDNPEKDCAFAPHTLDEGIPRADAVSVPELLKDTPTQCPCILDIFLKQQKNLHTPALAVTKSSISLY